jgi:hypothetical protein
VHETAMTYGLTATHLVTLASAILAAVVVMIGWFITNKFSIERENSNRRAEMRTAYIVDAYERLALAANRPEITPEFSRMLELAVSKIQLLGDNTEISAVNHFLDTWGTPQPDGRPRGELDPLLFSLRASLRSELSLPKVDGPVRWIRPMGGAR